MQKLNEMNVDRSIRVLIVDDHSMVRDGLRALLDFQSDITLVGEAGDGVEGLRLAQVLRPDVLLLDLVMPCLGGLEATKELRKKLPDVKILVFSMLPAEVYAYPAMQAGAVGYLLKGVVAAEIPAAIRAARNGGQVWPDLPQITRATEGAAVRRGCFP